jgi:hypothetical protein
MRIVTGDENLNIKVKVISIFIPYVPLPSFPDMRLGMRSARPPSQRTFKWWAPLNTVMKNGESLLSEPLLDSQEGICSMVS